MLRSGFKVAPVGLGYSSVSMIDTTNMPVFQDVMTLPPSS